MACSYEFIFDVVKLGSKDVVQHTEAIVADNATLALQYAMDELQKFDDYVFVALIRRNYIIKTI